MAEITEEGYQDLRDYIEDNWIWLELRDDANNPIIRISVGDDRLNWTHEAGAQVLELTCVIKGEDADISPPQTFAASLIFDQETGGEPYSHETFTEFTIETDEDELTVIHQIEVPQVENG